MADTKPPIEEWWSQLSDDARETLAEHPRALLVGALRDEIVRVTGEEVVDGATLTEEEQEFIRTRSHPDA
jgi:hypothetical protein